MMMCNFSQCILKCLYRYLPVRRLPPFCFSFSLCLCSSICEKSSPSANWRSMFPACCYVNPCRCFCCYFVTECNSLDSFLFVGIQRSVLGPFADLTRLHALSHGAQDDPVMTLCRSDSTGHFFCNISLRNASSSAQVCSMSTAHMACPVQFCIDQPNLYWPAHF